MQKTRIRVSDPLGMHARPAAEIVNACKQVDSEVTFYSGEQRANGRSILELILLNATCGTEVEVIAEGKEEELAVRKILSVFGPSMRYGHVG